MYIQGIVANSTPRITVAILLSFSISSAFTRTKSTMVIAGCSSSSCHGGGAFKTLAERVTFAKEIKKSKFIAIAAPIYNEQSANSFLSEVRDNRATHNCWAYKIGDQYRSSDDGEPSGTAGKPMYSAIVSSGIDRVMVVMIRYFGGIKLGTGGLVRAYGGVTSECLKNAPTCFVKSKVPMGIEVSFDLLGLLYHQFFTLGIRAGNVHGSGKYDVETRPTRRKARGCEFLGRGLGEVPARSSPSVGKQTEPTSRKSKSATQALKKSQENLFADMKAMLETARGFEEASENGLGPRPEPLRSVTGLKEKGTIGTESSRYLCLMGKTWMLGW